MQSHQVFQHIGQFGAVRRFTPAVGVLGRQMRMRQMVHIRQQRAELLTIGANAAHRHAAKAHAMIAAFAPDQPHAGAFAARLVIGECDFQRRIGGFAAGIGEENAVQPIGCHIRNPRGGFKGDGVAKLEGGREIHDRGLLLDRLHNLPPAMPGIAAPQARGTVQNLPPFRRVVMHALSAGEHARAVLEILIVRIGHPERVQIIRARHIDLIHRGISGISIHTNTRGRAGASRRLFSFGAIRGNPLPETHPLAWCRRRSAFPQAGAAPHGGSCRKWFLAAHALPAAARA